MRFCLDYGGINSVRVKDKARCQDVFRSNRWYERLYEVQQVVWGGIILSVYRTLKSLVLALNECEQISRSIKQAFPIESPFVRIPRRPASIEGLQETIAIWAS